MDLEEKIARLIDPEAWKTVDYLTELGVTGGPRHMGGAGSIEAARRVIKGLGLTANGCCHDDPNRECCSCNGG